MQRVGKPKDVSEDKRRVRTALHKTFFTREVQPKNDSFARKVFENTEGIPEVFRGFRKDLAAEDGVL